MSTVSKGNCLESKLYDHLMEELSRGELIYGVYPPKICQLHRKKKYYCRERGDLVEFDVVVEIRRISSVDPHSFLVFECKNHSKPLEDKYVREFSDKLGSVFGQAAKGVVVVSSKLQSGAEQIARSRRIGVAKFDENGIDIVLDRSVGVWTESSFIEMQLTESAKKPKSLKFSAFIEERYFGSFRQFLGSILEEMGVIKFLPQDDHSPQVPFLPESEIQNIAQKNLSLVQYVDDEVDVKKICEALSVRLFHLERTVVDQDGNQILGSADFENQSIEINQHGNKNRERFTVAHEIGHFSLAHAKYLRSETIIVQDFFESVIVERAFNFERLEYQANIFASHLLLPEAQFRSAVTAQRQRFGTFGRSFGYIFVDDQPCNYAPYNQMLAVLSAQFGVSMKAIEIRLKRAGLLTDNRKTTTQAI